MKNCFFVRVRRFGEKTPYPSANHSLLLNHFQSQKLLGYGSSGGGTKPPYPNDVCARVRMFCLKEPSRPGIQDPSVLRAGFLVPWCTQMFLGPGIQYPGAMAAWNPRPWRAPSRISRTLVHSNVFGAWNPIPWRYKGCRIKRGAKNHRTLARFDTKSSYPGMLQIGIVVPWRTQERNPHTLARSFFNFSHPESP